MLRRFRRTFAVTVALLGAALTPVVLAAPAQADPFDCILYLANTPFAPPINPAMEQACNSAFSGTIEGHRACVAGLRAEGFADPVPFEACRRGAPSASAAGRPFSSAVVILRDTAARLAVAAR